MLWANSDGAGRLYKHYFDEVITKGKLVLDTPTADALAHTLRGVLKGYHMRNEIPYSALYKNVVVSVRLNQVVLTRKVGTPAIDPISDRDMRISAATTYNEVLSAIGSMKDGRIDRVAFLKVTDLDEDKKRNIVKLCEDASFAVSLTSEMVVIIK